MEIGGEEERKLLSIVDSGAAAAAAAAKAFYHISSPAKLPKVALSIFSLSLSPGPARSRSRHSRGWQRPLELSLRWATRLQLPTSIRQPQGWLILE